MSSSSLNFSTFSVPGPSLEERQMPPGEPVPGKRRNKSALQNLQNINSLLKGTVIDANRPPVFEISIIKKTMISIRKYLFRL
jgi:hypothetical protein